ncbi:MAG: T9SS type A sorting domain-containing protein [Bacteroidetes bacterium]|nr:T9SS type A sorting domain-containing protein [Bacteroidota bacterium]
MKKVLIFSLFVAQFSMNAVTWKVGATQTYTSLSSIVNLVQNSDTVKIDGGVYLNDPMQWTKNNLVFIGLGTGSNRSIMKWNGGDIANGKGIWVFGNPATTGSITVDNVVFEGARISDANGANGAGIRYQAKDLTIRNCLFNSCQNGILEGGSYSGSVISIINSEFNNNGYEFIGNANSGYEHSIYISSQTDSLLVRNCYFHDPRGEGNIIKTRAQKSYILYNYIDEANGQGSWEINIAQGGLNVIIGNVIIQGANSINHGMISYDAASNPIENFYFINNTVINKYVGNFNYFNVTPTSGINKYKVYNNIFTKVSGASMSNFIAGTLGAALDTVANRILPNYTSVGFVNATTDNYHLTSSAASFINNSVNAGVASSGYNLNALYEYVAFTSSLAPRVMSGSASDIGAYEFASPTSVSENKGLSQIVCYPNPAIDAFTIDLGTLTYNKAELVIFNTEGKEVKRVLLKESKTNVNPGSDLKKGLYYYKVCTDGAMISSGKVILH